ncbi:MAG: DtxR family transcriptional regulator [Bryobacteraceae bacterium]|nr:DtxR family transcriptional regulator [Bryobacteraceae bacterium]
MQAEGWLILAVVGLAVAILIPQAGIRARWRRWNSARSRVLFEDALKHLLDQSQRAQPPTRESLGGALGISGRKLLNLIARMEAKGVLQSVGGALRLTPEGQRHALQVVRAHRLLERYLADEARVPLGQVHSSADKAEHGLTGDRLDELEAHLGYPQRDPHGDPIPHSDGSFSPVDTVPLTDWPVNASAEIAHVEDEPEFVLRQILALGLRPHLTVRVLEACPEHLVVSDGEREHRLPPVIAANIHVGPVADAGVRLAGSLRLAQLPDGREAEVVALDPAFRGFSRRRLMDLGLTPKARVRAELSTAFGDPRAYRVRGTVIALRNEQANRILVRPLEGTGAPMGAL